MHARFKLTVQQVVELTDQPWTTHIPDGKGGYTQEHHPGGQKYGESVTFTPVYEPNPENAENHSFWKATPWGPWPVQIDNPAMWGKWTVGDQFYVDFTKAEKAT